MALIVGRDTYLPHCSCDDVSLLAAKLVAMSECKLSALWCFVERFLLLALRCWRSFQQGGILLSSALPTQEPLPFTAYIAFEL